MAYDASKPFTYGIPDGDYMGRPTTASFYEKDGKLILDIKFAVRDPQTGAFYKKENGYEWEAQKRHWITNKDGGFNEATINGIKEWAKGWACADLSAFYWFQQPDANGTPFGNLAAIGEVRLNFTTDKQTGAQNLWVHDPDKVSTGRKAFTPDGAVTDQSALLAKWGAKAKAVFAATPRKVGAAAAAPAAPTAAPAAAAASTPAAAPSRPAAAPAPVPARPAAAPAPAANPWAQYPQNWAQYPQNADGAFAYYCSLLGEQYTSAKHDEKWFAIFDEAAQGKDPDQFGPADVQRLFAAVRDGMNG